MWWLGEKEPQEGGHRLQVRAESPRGKDEFITATCNCFSLEPGADPEHRQN